MSADQKTDEVQESPASEAPPESGADAGATDRHRHDVPHAHVVEDVAGFELNEGGSLIVYRARWQSFLPTIAVGVIYAAAWFYFVRNGWGGYATARLLFIVLAVGVPLLAALAFLRYQTVRVQVLADAVRYHPGWPRDMPVDMPLDLIDRVRVKRGLSGLVFGGGTLVMDLTTGERAAVADLGDPKSACEEIRRRMAVHQSDGPPVGAMEF